ncbi:MAG TPA: DUF305 domain-containing protein [Bryobacteraceae bacterium]|nr:DUF305 domain-containing protein [Bryobacteraceae bacterium]
MQPGAPGQPSKLLTGSSVWIQPKAPFKADVEFMQGMIMHHQQAVDMVALLRIHGKSPALQAFGEKISISQTDEIGFMKRWLESRGKPTTMEMDHSHMSAAGMKNMKMNMLMPGMLTPAQMAALTKARGARFDHLFLTGMIQHHGGALTMVDELFKTPGAAQDPVLFDFATDIDATQSAEIKIMRGMLDKEKK